MPMPHEVVDYLHQRFAELGAAGMLRGHTPRLAVLLVRDGFVVWSDGGTVWWLRGEIIVRWPVGEPEELWQRAYERFIDASSGSAT